MAHEAQNLISDNIRHPELWHPLYFQICNKSKLRPDTILNEVDPSGLNSDNWKSALNELQILNAIKIDKNAVTPMPLEPPLDVLRHPLDENNFKVWLLSRIKNLAWDLEKEQFTKQGHFILTYLYLIEKDKRHLNKNDSITQSMITDFWRKNNVDVRLNEQKTTFWISVASYLGLGYRVPGGISIALDPSVFFEILKVISMGQRSKKISLDLLMALLDSNFKLFPSEESGVHKLCDPITSQAFYWQYQHKHIKLTKHGDSRAFLFQDTPLRESYSEIEVVY